MTDLDKNEIHENYKKILNKMLRDYSIELLSYMSRYDCREISLKMIIDFSSKWVEDHISEPKEIWNPGEMEDI